MIAFLGVPRRAGLLPPFLLAVACADPVPNEVARPDATDAPPADTAVISTDSLPMGLSEEALREWRAVRDALVGARSTLGIGDLEEGPAVFGEITDVAIDAAGNILVLDGQAVRVSVFDTEGAFDDRLFVAAWQEEGNTVVHEISGAGIVSSFGTGYPSDDWLLQFLQSEGLVACLDRPTRLAHAFKYASLVRLFLPDGSLLWNAALSDHTPMEITTTPGSVSMSVPDDYDLLASIHGTPSGHIVLQYAHRRAGIDPRLRTYLVDAATGFGALLSEDLPSIKFIGPESYVAAFSDPYPRIEVRAMDGWGRTP